MFNFIFSLFKEQVLEEMLYAENNDNLIILEFITQPFSSFIIHVHISITIIKLRVARIGGNIGKLFQEN